MTFTAAHLKRFKTALAHGLVALLFGLGSGQALATDINISNKPLDTLEGVFFTGQYPTDHGRLGQYGMGLHARCT